MTFPVVLHPDPARTGIWAVVSVAAVGLAGWVAVDAATSVLAWVFFAGVVAVATFVGAQAVVPDRFVIRLDEQGIEVRLPWQHERLAWTDIAQARIVRVVGEDLLELQVRPVPAQLAGPRAVGVWLPIGADLPTLHAVLAATLGRADPPPVPARPTSRA